MHSWEPARGWILQCSQGLITNWGRGCILTSCVQRFCRYVCVYSPSLATGWPTRTTHKWTQVFFFSCLCWVFLRPVAAPQQVFRSVSPHVLPPKMKHIPVTTRREVSTCILSRCRKCYHTLLSVWQLFPVYSHWCGYWIFLTLSM